ncbi:hypothetical protein [Phenylobacterium sp.]|uniref:hypothetical protein n=1 Tax=Phenylobacterium sp. TaxID=1871053 RepID=UPI0026394CBF|nr:hypothetical protein [Phenylobacterium sp.]
MRPRATISPANVVQTDPGSSSSQARAASRRCFVEGNQVSFRDDVYGWDAEVLRQLDAASATYA